MALIGKSTFNTSCSKINIISLLNIPFLSSRPVSVSHLRLRLGWEVPRPLNRPPLPSPPLHLAWVHRHLPFLWQSLSACLSSPPSRPGNECVVKLKIHTQYYSVVNLRLHITFSFITLKFELMNGIFSYILSLFAIFSFHIQTQTFQLFLLPLFCYRVIVFLQFQLCQVFI
jgi:hypothetical protein